MNTVFDPNIRVHNRPALWLIMGLLLISRLGVFAQTPSAPVVLDPVVVREVLLTASPATVSRFDLAGEPVAANSLGGLAQRAANFFVSANGAHSFNDTFALRGLTNTPIFGAAAVSCYLDDLPLGSAFTFPSDLTGFAAAELHRGPSQNTLYGRAGSAGVITLSTPVPGSRPGGEIRGGVADYRATQVGLSVLSAAGGATDVYVNAAYAARAGYVTNTVLHRTIDDQESLSGLARLCFRPAGGGEFTLLVTALRARDGEQPLVPLGGPLFTVARTSEGVTSVNVLNAALTAAFATPAGRLTATTSVTDWDLGPYNSVLDFGFAELNNVVAQRQRNLNEEIKLTSDPRQAVRWQAGTFWSEGRTDGAFARLFGPFTYERSSYRLDAQSLAAYGETTFPLTEALGFTAGLRAEESRLRQHRVEAVPVPHASEARRESTALLPKVAFRYQLNREAFAFAGLGAGFKPGGYSAFTGNAGLAAFNPERTRTFEAGLTWENTGRKLQAVVRVFYYDITGYQIERSFATGAGVDDYLVVNAPHARSLGSEVELTWHAAAGLTCSFDLGVTQVTLREFRDPYTGTDYRGKSAPYVPDYDAALRMDYRSDRGWFGGVALNANGRTYYTEGVDRAFAQPAYALLGAQLGYDRGRYLVRLYARNLTGGHYYSAISPGTGHATPGAPRTIGLETRIRF
jgi:outer membrane receptor protein involved in Fe transport